MAAVPLGPGVGGVKVAQLPADACLSTDGVSRSHCELANRSGATFDDEAGEMASYGELLNGGSWGWGPCRRADKGGPGGVIGGEVRMGAAVRQ